jgi:hypothetical protein
VQIRCGINTTNHQPIIVTASAGDEYAKDSTIQACTERFTVSEKGQNTQVK